MTPIDPNNRKTWRVHVQPREGEPTFRAIWYNNEEGWECYLAADGISGVGYTTTQAYRDWLQRTRSVERAFK